MDKDCIDRAIDHFVDVVNSSYREPVVVSDTPASVLIGDTDGYGFSDWRIKPFSDTSWIDALEKKLNISLPYSYKSLVSRYIFPAFESLELMFYANTPEGTDYYEFRTRLFSNKVLSKLLIQNRYLQFAQPAEMDYDPVCFDLSRGDETDCPIVRIDHEYILCDSIIKITEKVAPSFTCLLSKIDI